MTRHRDGKDSFEATYPRYEFSELVRLGAGLAGLIATVRKRRTARRRVDADRVPSDAGVVRPLHMPSLIRE